MRLSISATLFLLLILAAPATAAHPLAAARTTSLTDPGVKYTVPDRHYVVLKRAEITAVIVDNEAIDVPECPGHKAGYNGIAVLKRTGHDTNYFVPSVAGLNFEHIHDGTLAIDKAERFEPRQFPMQLRVIDEHTVELHQPPTPNFGLESCSRFRLAQDGTIEYTFECIARRDKFRQGYIGLFWASYIQQPEATAIHFVGRKAADDGSDQPPALIRSTSPRHGVDSTHPPSSSLRAKAGRPRFEPKLDPAFSLTLVNHPSPFVYTQPWFYGVRHGLAFVQEFRTEDQIWFAQSPSGGGNGNPAWDFQWFIPDYKVDEAYGFTMQAQLLPFKDQKALEDDTRTARERLTKLK